MDSSFGIFDNLKKIREKKLYSAPIQQLAPSVPEFNGEDFINTFQLDKTKGKLKFSKKLVSGSEHKKVTDKSSVEKRKKNKENVSEKKKTANETNMIESQMLEEENDHIAKRLRSSVDKTNDVEMTTPYDGDLISTNKKRSTRSTTALASAHRNTFRCGAGLPAEPDVIDLTNCSSPRNNKIISIDCYDDYPLPLPPTTAVAKYKDDDIDSLEILNPQVSIKIRWNGSYLTYKIRKYQKFSRLMQLIAEEKNAQIEDIVLNLQDKFVKSTDTPDSIGYKVYQFLDGRIIKQNNIASNLNATTNVTNHSSHPSTTNLRKNSFYLKVQSKHMKLPLDIEMNKSDPLQILYLKCAEQLDLRISEFKLSLDGEDISLEETPEQLDLDGGEIFEIHFNNIA